MIESLLNLSREENYMSLDYRMASLKSKHKTLEHEIRNEERRPLPDEMHLHVLKKQKLLLKDEIVGIIS